MGKGSHQGTATGGAAVMSFEDAMRSAGLLPKRIVADGQIHRCPTADKPRSDNGWYSLHPDGHGVFGDWAINGGSPLGSWRDEAFERRMSDPAFMRRVQAEQEARRAAQRQQAISAIQEARAFWSRHVVPMVGLHPYLADKGLSALGCAGMGVATKEVRYSWDDCPRIKVGDLIVPVYGRGGVLINLQSIDEHGQKLFWLRAPMKGGHHMLQRGSHGMTVIVEGASTGLAVFQSVRMARVVIAFDAGNLLRVVEAVSPAGNVVIAADNDWRTAQKPHMQGRNPGIEAATAAAASIGAGVTWPEGIDGSDWADMLKEFGEGAGRRIERQIQAAAKYVLKGVAVP